jgi:TonB family protein
LLARVRDNLESVWKLPRIALAQGSSPIHLLEADVRGNSAAAQFSSMGVHILLLAAIFFVLVHPLARPKPGLTPGISSIPALEFTAPKWLRATDANSGGKSGSSGDHNPLPPTSGELAPTARMILAPPRLPDGRPHPLPQQVAVFAADAPELTRPVSELGLPWMSEKNNSAGTGKNGIGIGERHGMGDDGDDGSGAGIGGIYLGAVVTKVVCRVCPDPLYSDEARKQKLQGTVMLRVLVGADGRVHEVQVTRGLGLGLDENAVSAVRAWQFVPATIGARRPVSSWITIETVFRLY